MNTSTSASLDIRFATTKAVAFAPRPAPVGDLLDQLKKRLGPTPGIYFAEPAILDLSAWNEAEVAEYGLTLKAFQAVFQKAGVNLVEVRSSLSVFDEEAEQLGLRLETPAAASPAPAEPTPDTATAQPAEDAEPVTEAVAKATQQEPESPENVGSQADAPADAEPTEARRTLVIDQPVRSGQKIYAQGADLIIMGQVSAGAEVIADGNVHVYGVLRGRALAGAAGDRDARILSTCFEPELVAVAGYYLTFEGGFPPENQSKPTLVFLDQHQEPESLRLKSINIR